MLWQVSEKLILIFVPVGQNLERVWKGSQERRHIFQIWTQIVVETVMAKVGMRAVATKKRKKNNEYGGYLCGAALIFLTFAHLVSASNA